MDNKFTDFLAPYLAFIDKGEIFRKPFGWMYVIIAFLNLLLPLYILIKAIDIGIFEAPAAIVFAMILFWIVLAAAGWFSFQIWWNRARQVVNADDQDDKFVAIPVVSHFIQTVGEWFGTWFGFVGLFITLISMILLKGGSFVYSLGLPLPSYGWLGIVLFPIIGLLIILFTRFISESWNAIAAIANNTAHHKPSEPEKNPAQEPVTLEE